MPTVDSGKYIHLQNKKSRIQSETQLELQQQVCFICADMHRMWGDFIGETKLKLRERMTFHRQHLQESKYRILPASSHIAQCAKHEEIKFTVFPFYQISVKDDDMRRVKEQYCMKKFEPALNSKKESN